jgi:hypothetical protein
LNVDFDKV